MSNHTESEIAAIAALIAGESLPSGSGMSPDMKLLTEAITDFSSSLVIPEEKEEIIQHKPHAGAGNADTLISKGKPFKPLLGYVHRIPHVSMVDFSNDPSKDEHHAYVQTKQPTHYGIDKLVNRHIGEYASHDEAVAAIKKFHKLD